jgi:hypothetical protein
MFEAYKVATTLSVTNRVSSVLALITSDFAKTDRAAVKLKATLNHLTAAQMGLAGAMVGGAGLLGLSAIHAMVKPATEYVHQLELAKAAGMSHLEIAQATAAAWKTAGSVMTSSPTENLKAIRELRMVFGDTKDAIAFLPQMQRLQGLLDNTLHGAGGVGSKDVAFTAAKMLELRGASMNPQTFQQQADLIAKAVIASGGKVTPQMLLMAQKYSGIGGTSYSNDFMYGILPTLVQELGGSSTGTSLTSMYRAVVGGRMDKRSLAVWKQLGLADTSHADIGKDFAMVNPQNISGSGLFKTSPYRYVQEVLLPALVAHGITSPADQSAAIDRLFSNRTAGRIANILGVQGPRLDKDFNLIGQAGSTDAFDRMLRRDPVMAMKALGEQWETLKTSLGIAVIPVLLPMLRNLTSAFNTLGEFFHRHPTITKALTLTFTALSGLAVIGGGLLIAGAALKLLPTPLSLLVAPLQGLAGIGLAGIATGLGLIVAALVPLAAIAYHQQVADRIDDVAPGIGDFLLGAKNSKPSSSNRGFAPPSNGGGNVIINNHIDPEKNTQSVVNRMTGKMSGPATSGSGFDGRMAPSYGVSGSWP